jgi:hypothetical protein
MGLGVQILITDHKLTDEHELCTKHFTILPCEGSEMPSIVHISV